MPLHHTSRPTDRINSSALLFCAHAVIEMHQPTLQIIFENARVVFAGIEFAEKIKEQQCDVRRFGGVQASHAEMWQRPMAA
jgi:hypothetical protein